MSVTVPCLGCSAGMLALHAPDGMFSLSVNLVFAALIVVLLAFSHRKLARSSDHRLAPVMGVMAAFVFASQMVNFPVASGTTGHLLGGTLTAILLGPWAGTLVMAAVIVFQALLGDGGVTVLGPNIFNMGVLGTLMAYFIYRAALGAAPVTPARTVAASFFAAWLAVVLASLWVSIQLAVSDTVSFSRTFPAMVLTHMAIGIGEALITAGVVAFVLKTRASLIYDHKTILANDRSGGCRGITLQPEAVSELMSSRDGNQGPIIKHSSRGLIVVGLGVSLVIAFGLSLLPLLWDYPDGLESVGIEQGFLWEECAKAEDGALKFLPAYPLGVRLKMVDGTVRVVHGYARQATSLAEGDVLLSVAGRRVGSLADVANTLGFNEESKVFSISPGTRLEVAVRRASETMTLFVETAAAPVAGTLSPWLALLPGYQMPGVNGVLGTSLAGALGTVVIFFVSFLVGRAFTRPTRLEAALANSAPMTNDAPRSR